MVKLKPLLQWYGGKVVIECFELLEARKEEKVEKLQHFFSYSL